jgi:putative phosphoribosyl transferase
VDKLKGLTEQAVTIPPVGLKGFLTIPEASKGVVLFAHGSGSSRLSPRNTLVARSLHHAQIATLLFDLLTDEEATDRRNVFDIPLLASRLLQATGWLGGQRLCRGLPMGYFGASTGAAAALVATAQAGPRVAAIVSRGGRPDLANGALPSVTAETLLIVGDADTQVLALNRAAFARLNCVKKLTVVAGATHLFEEPGKLEEVAKLACRWFSDSFDRVSQGDKA